MQEYIQCEFCEKDSSKYIQLLGTYICEECEKQIINTSCEDIKYEYYNIIVKDIWKEYLLSL